MEAGKNICCETHSKGSAVGRFPDLRNFCVAGFPSIEASGVALSREIISPYQSPRLFNFFCIEQKFFMQQEKITHENVNFCKIDVFRTRNLIFR